MAFSIRPTSLRSLEVCSENILANNPSRGLDPNQFPLISEKALGDLWDELYIKVSEDALGLQTAMRDIKNGPTSTDLTTTTLFKRLAEKFSLEFEEAGIPVKDRIPWCYSEYEALQNTLGKKWENEALLAIWGDSQSGLIMELIKITTFRKTSTLKQPKKIRTWFNKAENQIYLNRFTRLSMSDAQIKVCPKEINKFQAIKTLDLRTNLLRNFCNDLTPCVHLKVLILCNNKIQKFNPNLSCNSELECLDVSLNCLRSFSASLANCPNIKQINLSFNRISEFSSDLRSSKKLDTLNLNFNKLIEFHDNLLPEEKPKHVYLSRNLIPNLKRTPPGFRRNARHLLPPSLPLEASVSPKPQRANVTL